MPKEFSIIAIKMKDFIVHDTRPMVGDIVMLDYIASKGAIDLEELATEVGEDRWYSWTQYVMDLKRIANGN